LVAKTGQDKQKKAKVHLGRGKQTRYPGPKRRQRTSGGGRELGGALNQKKMSEKKMAKQIKKLGKKAVGGELADAHKVVQKKEVLTQRQKRKKGAGDKIMMPALAHRKVRGAPPVTTWPSGRKSVLQNSREMEVIGCMGADPIDLAGKEDPRCVGNQSKTKPWKKGTRGKK